MGSTRSIVTNQHRKASKGRERPKGYVPGLGREASGFTTQADIGNMASSA